jgi:hypothetical protein
MIRNVLEVFLDIMHSGEEEIIHIILKLIPTTTSQDEERGVAICKVKFDINFVRSEVSNRGGAQPS